MEFDGILASRVSRFAIGIPDLRTGLRNGICRRTWKPHITAGSIFGERQNAEVSVIHFVDSSYCLWKVLPRLPAELGHVFRPLPLNKLPQTRIQGLSRLAEFFFKRGFGRDSTDGRFEFLYIVHYGNLTEANEELAEHARSAALEEDTCSDWWDADSLRQVIVPESIR